MSTQTTNYQFVKPDLTDPADINVLNDNWDKVDEELDSLENYVNLMNETLGKDIETLQTDLNNTSTNLEKQIGTLQPKITYGTSAPSGGNNGDVYIQLIEG